MLGDSLQPLRWLVESILTDDCLCVIGAPAKSAKTWVLLDLVLSVATGKDWLETFRVHASGPVVLVAPEGGRNALARRAQTILESSGGCIEDVELVFVRTRSVNLTDRRDIADIEAAVKAYSPTLVALDSLYLGLGDVRTSQLSEVGRALRSLSDITGEHGCATVLTHHLAKTQIGAGIQALSGSGVAEWASTILIGTPLRQAPTGTGLTELAVAFEVTGREIPGLSFTAVFKIEGDPADLSARPRFAVDVRVGPSESSADGLSWTERRVFEALGELGDREVMLEEIDDVLARRGGPLKHTTLKAALSKLADLDLADGADGRWWVLPQPRREVPR
jgi:hypothetical protein